MIYMSNNITFNGYEYNKFGVCLNPDKPYSFGKDHYTYFEIEVSETPNGWSYGYDWHFDCVGGGEPCKIDDPKPFPTRSKAIIACAKGIKICLSHLVKKNPKMEAELDRIIAEESGKKPQIKQYTIFDFL